MPIKPRPVVAPGAPGARPLAAALWPQPDLRFAQRRLFEDARFYHPDGKARLLFDAPRGLPESPDAQYPFLLLTGRGTSAQWHTETRTAKSPVLRKLSPKDLYVEINPLDAAQLSIHSDEWVLIASRRGRVRARAFVTPCIQRGNVFLPMHYRPTNRLTDPVFDPHSRQPSYKACAVQVRKIEHWEVDE